VNRLRIIGLYTLLVIFISARLASAVESSIAQGVPDIKEQQPPSHDGQKIVVEKKNSLAEMREWLNRRNLDRKLKGSAFQGPGNTNHYPSTLKPLFAHNQKSHGLGWGGASPPQTNYGLLERQSGPSPDGKLTANFQRGRSAASVASGRGRTKKRRGLELNHPVRKGSEPATNPSPLGEGNLELYSTTLSPDGRIHHRLIINEEGPDQFQVATGTSFAVPNSTYSPKPKRWVRPPFKR